MNEREKVRTAIKRVLAERAEHTRAKEEARNAAARAQTLCFAVAKAEKDAARCVRAVFGQGTHRVCCGGRVFVFDKDPNSVETHLEDDYAVEVFVD
jgi:hypothetical protein